MNKAKLNKLVFMLAKINVIWFAQTHYLLFTEIEDLDKLKVQQLLCKWSYFTSFINTNMLALLLGLPQFLILPILYTVNTY